MRGNGSPGYWYCKTSHFPSLRRNYNNKSNEEEVLKCLWVKKVVDIGLVRTATVPQVIVEAVKVMGIVFKRPASLPLVITEFVEKGQVLPATTPLLTTEDMLIQVNLHHKRPSTLPLTIREQ